MKVSFKHMYVCKIGGKSVWSKVIRDDRLRYMQENVPIFEYDVTFSRQVENATYTRKIDN